MSHIKKLDFEEDLNLKQEGSVAICAHDPEEGILLGAELNEIVGPIIVQLQMAGDIENDEDRNKAVSKALGESFTVMSPKKQLSMYKRLLSESTVTRTSAEGKKEILSLKEKDDFKKFFSLNYKALIPLCQAVIDFNDFLEVNVSNLFLRGKTEEDEMQSETEKQDDK